MVEITHGGTWIRWRSLDRRDKWLAGVSVAAAIPGAIIGGLVLGEAVHTMAYSLGAGRHGPVTPVDEFIASPAFGYAVLAALGLAIVSGVAWWRFSLRQDELFNRIQNYALGQAGGWSMAVVTTWWFIELAGLAVPVPPGAFVLVILTLMLGFWFYGVRRWA